MTEHRMSIRRACCAVGSRTAYYRVPRAATQRDAAVIEVLNQVVAQRPRWGFWKCFDRMRLDGYRWNHKRVHRVYCSLRLNLPRGTKRRVPTRSPLCLRYFLGIRCLRIPTKPDRCSGSRRREFRWLVIYRAIIERYPPGPERKRWLRWLRQSQDRSHGPVTRTASRSASRNVEPKVRRLLRTGRAL